MAIKGPYDHMGEFEIPDDLFRQHKEMMQNYAENTMSGSFYHGARPRKLSRKEVMKRIESIRLKFCEWAEDQPLLVDNGESGVLVDPDDLFDFLFENRESLSEMFKAIQLRLRSERY